MCVDKIIQLKSDKVPDGYVQDGIAVCFILRPAVGWNVQQGRNVVDQDVLDGIITSVEEFLAGEARDPICDPTEVEVRVHKFTEAEGINVGTQEEYMIPSFACEESCYQEFTQEEIKKINYKDDVCQSRQDIRFNVGETILEGLPNITGLSTEQCCNLLVEHLHKKSGR